MNWTTKKLGEVCNVQKGKTITQKSAIKGNIPVIGGGTKPTYYHNEANRNANCITISGSGANAGFVNFWESPIYASDCSTVECNDEKQDQKFVYYFLRSKQNLIYSSFRKGAAQPHVYATDLATIDFPIIPIEEQRRIAAMLDKADAIHRKREQALALADDFLRSTFLDMFGDLEINPLDWATKCLGELITLSPQNGLYKPSTDYGSGTSILRIDSFYDGYLNRNCKFKKVRVSDHEISKYRLNEKDIVINRVNSKSHLGKSALIDSLVETTVFESNMMRFSTNEELILPRFMVDQIQSNYVKRQILSKARDSVNQSSINQEDVCNLMIRVPNLNLQNKYIEVVEKNLSNKHSTIRALEQAGGLTQSLSQRAFSGEL